VNINFKTFCSKDNEKSRYDWNFEAPEFKDVTLTHLHIKLLKFLIGVFFIGFFSYIFLFRKFNNVSKRYNLYFINENFEYKLAEYISKKLQYNFDHCIYKRDTEEVELVFKIYKNLLEKNKIEFNEITKQNIFVIDSPIIGCCLLKNGDLFISNKIIEMSNYDEDQCALFIGAELASMLMGRFTKRIFKYFLNECIYARLNTPYDPVLNVNRDFVTYKRSEMHYLSKYVLFYPETEITFYFEELEILKFTMNLLNQSEYDLMKVLF
jgi:hypothetical protein